jgi:predicted RNA-binding Zn-ribbon protein involved in translation (DUF1610 family)
VKCPSCGRDLSAFSPDSAFCPYCGQGLKPKDSAEVHFCPHCGQEISGQFAFCPHCGKGLLSAQTKPRGYHDGLGFTRRMAKSAVKAIINLFSKRRKKRKLYQQWAEFSELPPDEVPSMDDLRQNSKAEKSKEQSPDSETD